MIITCENCREPINTDADPESYDEDAETWICIRCREHPDDDVV